MGRDYAHPEALVTTEWVEDHLDDPGIRLLEVDYEPVDAYNLGHLPGALLVDWKRDIKDPETQTLLSRSGMEALMSRLGVSADTTLVVYGDARNWYAAYALWVFKLYGHRDVRLVNGGRETWFAEGRKVTEEVPLSAPSEYRTGEPSPGIRATLSQVRAALSRDDFVIVDVRSSAEYECAIPVSSESPAAPPPPKGHIPGARNVPWTETINDDDTFKPVEELEELYRRHRVTPDRSVITYCQTGARGSHSWFVLSCLLGYPEVMHYDGSWRDWTSHPAGAAHAPVTAPVTRGMVDLRDSEQECGDTALKLVRRAIKELSPGEVLTVLTNVAEQAFVVRAWARKTGRSILEDEREGKERRILVEQAGA
jgi:thiosulfate/3-mercaptopyruvate sulfurtransferase